MRTEIHKVMYLSDSADWEITVQWLDEATLEPYALSNGWLEVRQSEDSETAIFEEVASIDVDGNATVVLEQAQIQAAELGLLNLVDAVWEFVVERTLDSRKLSIVGGPVEWSKGAVHHA